jgi:DNA-binding MarR family transcriptional regulator
MKNGPDDMEFFGCRECVCLALRHASRAVTRHYERTFRGTGMRATQFSILSLLTQTGPMPISLLAEKMGLERTTLTRNLRPLEGKGWIRVGSVDADQRVHQIELTSNGHAAARKALVAWRRAQKGVGSILDRLDLKKVLRTR